MAILGGQSRLETAAIEYVSFLSLHINEKVRTKRGQFACIIHLVFVREDTQPIPIHYSKAVCKQYNSELSDSLFGQTNRKKCQ
jgi:hypothetical protein